MNYDFFKSASVKVIFLIFTAVFFVSLMLIEIFTEAFFTKNLNKIFFEPEENEKVLRIAYSADFSDLSPIYFNAVNRSILSNVYEPLIKFDPYLQIKSGLALKWGVLDDQLTWKFVLRDGVKFHNGEILKSQDISDTIEMIRRSRKSELKAFIANIDNIEIIDDQIFHFILKQKDPFFLSKLTTILIFKQDGDDLLGTGFYKIKSFDPKKVELQIANESFMDRVNFQELIFQVIENPEDKVKALENKTIDIVVHLPVSYPETLVSENKVQVMKFPALETYFLGFDIENSVFKDIRLREAISFALDKIQMEALGGGAVEAANQFASAGVFGFNPKISLQEYDLNKATVFFREVEPLKRIELNLDIPENLSSLGEYIKNQLYKIGFDVSVNLFSNQELLDKIAKGKSDFYLLGWKHELGDINDFLINIVHTKKDDFGFLNAGYYENKIVDAWIQTAQATLDDKERQSLMQNIMKYIVEEDYWGIPLFNMQVLYGVQENIKFQPRYDGYIVGEEVSML